MYLGDFKINGKKYLLSNFKKMKNSHFTKCKRSKKMNLTNIYHVKSIILFIIIGVGIFQPLSEVIASNKAVAKGKGFEVSEQYVQAVVDLFTLQDFETKRKEYVTYSVRTKLFAQEAKKNNLDPMELKINPEVVNNESVSNLEMFKILVDDISFAEAYAQKLREKYEIPEVVLESYFKSNRNDFDSQQNDYSQMRKEIRKKIIKLKKNEVYDQAYNKLIKKYDVVVHE